MTEKTRNQIEEMKKQTIGVEIEMNNITREKAASLAAGFFGTGRYEYTARRNGYETWSAWDQSGREWKFQKDVSISGPDSQKCELVTPILSYDDIESLQELVRRLRKAGAKSDHTRGCGVHIHVGAKGLWSEGAHGVYVTARCFSGEIRIDTRGILFTIDAGNFAEAVDDISMDVRDITMRQLLESNGPDQLWIVGLEDGNLLVSKRDYSENDAFAPKWEGVYTPGKAKDAAIEFDGTWVLRENEEKFTIETEDQPWFFWVDEEENLLAQWGEEEKTRLVLDTKVSQVSACRGYSSNLYEEQDQGLVVLYLKGEKPYYRQYVYDVSLKGKKWLDSVLLLDEKVQYARVHRLNDYRLGFELTTDSRNLWMYTARTYVAQAVPREFLPIKMKKNVSFLYCPADTDLSVSMEPMVSEDMLTIQLQLNRELVSFDSTMRDVVTFNEDSIFSSDVEKISFENHDGGATITIKLKHRPQKLITYIYVNKAQVNDLLCKIGTYGTMVCPFMTATIDTTVYRSMDISETIIMGSKDSNLKYTPVGESTYRPREEVVSVAVQAANLNYVPVGYQDYDATIETVSFALASHGIVYQQTGTSPI